MLVRYGWAFFAAWTVLIIGLGAWNQFTFPIIQSFSLLWLIGGIGILGFWSAGRLRKRARDQNEMYYRMIADSTFDWEYWRAPDGKLLYCSPSAERITGYLPQQFYNDPGLLHRIVHPDDLPFVIDHTHNALNDIYVTPIDFRIIRPDGQTRWINHVCQAVYDDAKKFQGSRVSNRDITERKTIEQQLALQTVALQTAANGALITERDGTIVFVNAAFCALTGYTPREAIGKNPRDLAKSGKQDKSFYKTLWDALLAGRVWRGEIINRKKTARFLRKKRRSRRFDWSAARSRISSRCYTTSPRANNTKSNSCAPTRSCAPRSIRPPMAFRRPAKTASSRCTIKNFSKCGAPPMN
jgi:PAS domain S-box-containing protein